ncbi:MAG TPA: VOC family protein [Lysobacter sp.]|nr:VOC family protein [Lysobacter sp.]
MKKIEPYLFLNGRADEAIAFYQDALGAEVAMRMTFGESPSPSPMPLPPGWDKKVMHASLQVGDMLLMLSDGDHAEGAAFNGFRLSLTLDDEAAARRAFDKLADGGQVQMPLAQTFWAPLFGMLTDKFGIGWMIGLAA